ncbi:MAG TPA: ATP-binding protein [Opitutaceae bacterium]
MRHSLGYVGSGITGITSAILDRLLHGAETVVIEGKSYRMKDQIDPPPGT